MEFRLKNTLYRLTKEEIEKTMENTSPERIRKHYVTVNGRMYPIIQVIYECLKKQNPDISMLDISTMHARSILLKLGFKSSVVTD